MVGDTNQSLESNDKKGGRRVNCRAQELWKAFDDYNFIDMGFLGLAYTFTNGREGRAKI